MKGNKDKEAFRKTSAWKNWRKKLLEQQKTDFVTQKPLRKGANVHHLDPEHYDVLTEDRFVALNIKTHEAVEWLWKYYKKDPDVIKRLEMVMKMMKSWDNLL